MPNVHPPQKLLVGNGGSLGSSDGEFPDSHFGDLRDRGGLGKIFEIKFEGFLEVGGGFRFGGAEAGNVAIEAMGHLVGSFPVKGVVDAPDGTKLEVGDFLARREVLVGGFWFRLFIGLPEGICHAPAAALSPGLGFSGGTGRWAPGVWTWFITDLTAAVPEASTCSLLSHLTHHALVCRSHPIGRVPFLPIPRAPYAADPQARLPQNITNPHG
jgi:hypothetical protein